MNETPLLHNMSAPATTVISHRAGQYGSRVVFALPEAKGPLTPVGVLAWLDGRHWRSRFRAGAQADEAEAALRARLDAHARTLALPPAAVVSDRAAKGDRKERDLLTVLTVLAKSSGRVYLRDKEPNFAAIRPGRRVVLVIPPGWRPS